MRWRRGFPKIGHYTAMKRRGLLPQQNKQCFIATAVYSSPFSPEVQALRQWRDRSLSSTAIGRSFISTYYKYSHTIASYIEDKPFTKWIIRRVLNCFIWIINHKKIIGTDTIKSKPR